MADPKLQTYLSAAIFFLLVGFSGVRVAEQDYLYTGMYRGSLVCWIDGGKLVSYTGDLQKQEYSLTRADDPGKEWYGDIGYS